MTTNRVADDLIVGLSVVGLDRFCDLESNRSRG
jgi:hypothetical protein